MGIPMGMNFGLQKSTQCWKRKFRWLFTIEGSVSKVSSVSAPVLPPRKSARPNLQFKEFDVQHLTETIYFPSKPDWKPIPLSLYDLKCNDNPVFEWVRSAYDVDAGRWYPSLEIGRIPAWAGPLPVQPPQNDRYLLRGDSLKRTGFLTLFDGCGEALEEWVFENIWPQQINWGELEMSNSEIVTVDMTLRYDRAYEQQPTRTNVKSDQSC